MAQDAGLKLGMAHWEEGPVLRKTLVAALPGDPTRVVDLRRVERMRQAKLGEGCPEVLAEALIPGTLREVLAHGPRALHRIHQTVAYAEKWERRRRLPDALAPALERVRLQPCLERPLALREFDGTLRDRLQIVGPGGEIHEGSQPTLALVGTQGGRVGGLCLALADGARTLLGGWLLVGSTATCDLELHGRGQSWGCLCREWEGLVLPRLSPGEVVLLPAPEWAPLEGVPAGTRMILTSAFDALSFRLARIWNGGQVN